MTNGPTYLIFGEDEGETTMYTKSINLDKTISSRY